MSGGLIHALAHWLALGCMIGGNMLAISAVVMVPALILHLVCAFTWKHICLAHDLVQIHWMIGELRRQGRLWKKGQGGMQ